MFAGRESIAGLILVLFASQGVAQSGVSTNPAFRTVSVYQSDGSIQCDAKPGSALEAMALELTSAGVKVLGQEKRALPIALPTVCGSPTGSVNSYQIVLKDLPKVPLGKQFSIWAFDVPVATVARGGCGEFGMTMASLRQEMIDAAIVPIDTSSQKSSSKNNPGCRFPSGRRYFFEIPVAHLAAAFQLRFFQVATRSAEECKDVLAPLPGSAAEARLQPPLYLGGSNQPPRPKANVSMIALALRINTQGRIDSVEILTEVTRADSAALKRWSTQERYLPAVFEGCLVTSVANPVIHFGG